MATFPPRQEIMWDVIRVIAPQVDHMFVVLNEYEEIPKQFGAYPNVTAVIPDRDVKDAGKFYFPPASDDLVFTIDDDIIYPENYVQKTLELGERIDLTHNVIGYQANAWVYKKRLNTYGWRNHLFFQSCKKVFGVDVLGTGTACMLGANMPPLADVEHSKGYVDVGFSLWQRKQGNLMWTLPRDEDELKRNLPETLKESTLFNRVARKPSPAIQQGYVQIRKLSVPESGKAWKSKSQ